MKIYLPWNGSCERGSSPVRSSTPTKRKKERHPLALADKPAGEFSPSASIRNHSRKTHLHIFKQF